MNRNIHNTVDGKICSGLRKACKRRGSSTSELIIDPETAEYLLNSFEINPLTGDYFPVESHFNPYGYNRINKRPYYLAQVGVYSET